MSLIVLFSLAVLQGQLKPEFKKLDQFLNHTPLYSCTITSPGGVKATAVIDRTGTSWKMQFASSYGSNHYELIYNGKFQLELDTVNKVYERFPAPPNPNPYARWIDDGVPGFPNVLLIPSLPIALQNAPKLVETKTASGGVLFSSDNKNPSDTKMLKFEVNKFGQPIHYYYSEQTMMGKKVTDMTFSNYKVGRQVSKPSFNTKPPHGYDMFAFAYGPSYPQQFAPLPKVKLADGTPLQNQLGPGNTLLVFLQNPVASGLVDGLKSIDPSLKVVLLSSVADKVVGSLPVSDATLDQLGFVESPQFILVSKGVMQRFFEGFDPANPNTLFAQIREALAPAKP